MPRYIIEDTATGAYLTLTGQWLAAYPDAAHFPNFKAALTAFHQAGKASPNRIRIVKNLGCADELELMATARIVSM